MSGQLILAPPPRAKTRVQSTNGAVHREPPMLRVEACEICSKVFGKAECQRGQHTQLWLLQGRDDNGPAVFIAAAYYYEATLYAFSVLAVMDGTLYNDAMRSARLALEHLEVGINTAAVPF